MKSIERWWSRRATALILLCIALLLSAFPSFAAGQIYVTTAAGTPQNLGGAIATYGLDGTTINPALVSSPGPIDVAIAGQNFFVLNGGGEFAGSIGEFTTTGATINSNLISDFFGPRALAIAGNNLFLSYGVDRVAKYDDLGTTVADPFLQGLSTPFGLAVSEDGARVFIATAGNGNIGVYNAMTGAVINAGLITGLNAAAGLVISGNQLFIANSANGNTGQGSIGEYNLDGTVVNAALVTGLSNPLDLAVFDGHLYVVNNGTNSIGEYNAATGATINAALITGLSDPQGIAVVPEPATLALAAFGLAGLAIWRR